MNSSYQPRNRFLYFIGFAFHFIGYFLAHFLFLDRIIAGFASGGSEEWYRSILGNYVIQLICGIPLAVSYGIPVVFLAVQSKRLLETSVYLRLFAIGLVCLIGGFVIYFIIQSCLIFGSAF
jgi:hypothetical protein